MLADKSSASAGRRSRRRARRQDAVAVSEPKPAVRSVLDRVAALVDEPVVVEAEEHEVVEARLATVSPVPTMVRLQMAAPLTTGEAAAVSVARAQQAPERRRHGAPLPAGAQRQTVALDLRHDLGVAAEPPRGLGSYDRPVFQLGAAACIGGERGGVDVDDQPRARSSRSSSGRSSDASASSTSASTPNDRGGSNAGGACRSRSSPRLGRGSLPLLPAPLHDPLPRGVQRLHEQRAVLGREPGAQVQRAVLLEVVAHELELVRLARVLRRDPPEVPQRALELRRRQRSRELEQPLLGRPGRDPRQRANLRVCRLASRERRPDRRQLLQRLRDPQVLPRLAPGDPAAVGEAACGIVADDLLAELPRELEPPRRRGAQMRGKRRQLVLAPPLLAPALLRPLHRPTQLVVVCIANQRSAPVGRTHVRIEDGG